ncbi:MAG: hybrid sensor histidine kinase/response regulator [Anaerolineaceae bacterium]|nr:hybrid sensor histidine kinase/response regulator [Anaerolineaceae bacterium]
MTRILIVEDNASLRKDIVEMLGYEGFDVHEAENGRIGVNIARQYLPDLIICDIMMPELDGYGVLDELQTHPITATIPFIFLTAKTDPYSTQQAQGKGANAFMTKPFEVENLMAVIHAQLRKRQAFADIAEKNLEDLRENIITAVPHELRTPLTGILGFSDMLLTDSASMEVSEIQEMARYINEAATRLYRLIERYLTYAQIEIIMSDPDRIAKMREFATEDAAITIEDEILHKSQIAHRETDVHFNLQNGVFVAIQEEHLKKIVEELIDNAFKFSAPGTPVRVTTTITNNQYKLSIRNEGHGMKPDQIARIGAHMQFGRTQNEFPGIGFGLVTARRIAELHGGKLSIDSREGEFTCVSVILPLAQPE